MLALLRATRRTRARSAAIDGWSPISGSRSGAMGGMLARLLRLEEMLAVVLQLVDGFVDVGQRLVPALFLEGLVGGRGLRRRGAASHGCYALRKGSRWYFNSSMDS